MLAGGDGAGGQVDAEGGGDGGAAAAEGQDDGGRGGGEGVVPDDQDQLVWGL